ELLKSGASVPLANYLRSQARRLRHSAIVPAAISGWWEATRLPYNGFIAFTFFLSDEEPLFGCARDPEPIAARMRDLNLLAGESSVRFDCHSASRCAAICFILRPVL